MSYNANIKDYGRKFTSAGDVSAQQYTFFKRGSGGTAVQCDAGEAAVGVLWYTATAADRAISVITGGEPNVYVGTGGLTVGAEVASDADGKAVVATSGDVVLGYARTAVSADGLARIDFLGEAQFTKS